MQATAGAAAARTNEKDLASEQRLRVQLEKDLAATQKRLEVAEKARDTAIMTLEQATARGTTPHKSHR